MTPARPEANLAGGLVLNGARFQNSEYPELAKMLAENYAQQGFKSPDPNFTVLAPFPAEMDSHGNVVRGSAICPSRAICDLVGAVMPFDLNSSL
jgi:hypothetical protein